MDYEIVRQWDGKFSVFQYTGGFVKKLQSSNWRTRGVAQSIVNGLRRHDAAVQEARRQLQLLFGLLRDGGLKDAEILHIATEEIEKLENNGY